MNAEPTPEHRFILNELAELAETVEQTSAPGSGAMLFALNERLGVELGLAILGGHLSKDELPTFLQRAVMIASLTCGEVVNDTYGVGSVGATVH